MTDQGHADAQLNVGVCDVRKAKAETARLQLEWNAMRHRVSNKDRELNEAREYEGRQEVRITELKVQVDGARAELAGRMVAEAAGAQRVGTAEAGPGTTRKAVAQPSPSTSDLARSG